MSAHFLCQAFPVSMLFYEAKEADTLPPCSQSTCNGKNATFNAPQILCERLRDQWYWEVLSQIFGTGIFVHLRYWTPGNK